MSNTRRQFKVLELSISTDRINRNDGDNFSVDIKNLVIEMNIYEDIEKAYLTGSLLVADTFGLKSGMSIRGTERIKLRMKAPFSNNTVEKNFIVTGIQKNVKTNDRSDVYMLNIIEEHAYLSTLKRLSKSYTSSLEFMISNIARGELDKQLDTSAAAASAQSRTRYIVPYLTPLETLENIRDRMATVNGSPYFLFSTLRDQKLHLADLDLLYKQDVWNKVPYVYGENATNLVYGPNVRDEALARELGEYFVIQNSSETSIESSLKLIKSGAMGANYSTVDITSGTRYKRSHSGRDTALALINSLEDPSISVAVDNSLRLGSEREGQKALDEYQSVEFTQVAASKIFETGVTDYHSEPADAFKYVLKLKAAALKQILTNSVSTWTVTGTPYIELSNAGVGTCINAVFQHGSIATENQGKIDPERSGKYLIYKTKHTFTFVTDQYNVHMDVVKLTKRK